MLLKFIEVTNGQQNWGKFAVGRFTEQEWDYRSAVDTNEIRAEIGMIKSTRSLLATRGWDTSHIFVLDIQTGEGAIFRPHGYAKVDLMKHQIWVCPLYEPFLTWLYEQDLTDLEKLPAHIDLPDAPFEMFGHRRAGPKRQQR